MATILGSNLSDSNLTGAATKDLILGLQGDDTIQGNGGADTLVGGQGDDSVQYGSATAANATAGALIYGDEGSDKITSAGSSGSNTIVGGTSNAAIDVTADGADFIDVSADTGRDLVLGNYGDDTIFGPVASVSGGFGFLNQSSDAFDTLVGGYGNDKIISGVNPGAVPGLNNAPVLILGNQGNDTVNAFGPATVYGGQGDDFIQTASSTTENVIGGEGNDTIGVFGGNVTVLGGTGNAAIDSLGGALGDGNDYIFLARMSAAGNDFVLGNYGDDTIDATAVGAGSDTFAGGMGNDAIFVGATTNDLIYGNQGNDSIIGVMGSAGDTVAAGMGDDTIVYQFSSVGGVIYGNEGNNEIFLIAGGNDTIFGGNSSVDAVGNGDGSNYIDLNAGVGSVVGSVDPSVLIFGGSGNDNILVGMSLDRVTMTGGGGQNIYGFAFNTDSTSLAGAGSGLDIITDFVSGTDKIAVGDAAGRAPGFDGFIPTAVYSAGTSSQATLTAAANAALIGASVTGANAATFKFGSDNYVVADVNNSGTFTSGNDVLIDIKGTSTLTKNDFI